MRNLRAAAIAAIVLAPTIAHGQTVADADAGKKLALNVCAQCHFVAKSQTTIPRSDAPPFDQIAADPAVTELGLRVFLQTPHRNMPDLHLSRQETDDVIGFILNMRAQAGGK